MDFEKFKAWSLHPANSFYVCEYRGQFYGLLFSLRLKPEIFDKLIHFEMPEKELEAKHFASLEEAGSSYLLSFFAMNKTAASLLFISYYAHLIANQNAIEKVGMITMMEDAQKLIAHMQLSYVESQALDGHLTFKSYASELSDFLAHERVLKMLFADNFC